MSAKNTKYEQCLLRFEKEKKIWRESEGNGASKTSDVVSEFEVPIVVRRKSDGQLCILLSEYDKGILVKDLFTMKNIILERDTWCFFQAENYPLTITSRKREDLEKMGVTPMDEKEKVCRDCFKVLPIVDFYPNKRRTDGSLCRRPSCKDCYNAANGITVGKANKAVRPPYGSLMKCPCCTCLLYVGVTANVVLDHDHKSGNERLYICESCNSGLLRNGNDLEYLNKGSDYVDRCENMGTDGVQLVDRNGFLEYIWSD